MGNGYGIRFGCGCAILPWVETGKNPGGTLRLSAASAGTRSLIFLTEPIDLVIARPRSDRGNLNGFGTESHYFAAAGYYHCPALSVLTFLCA